MPVDSIKNIERAFTGRCPTIRLDNNTPINTVVEIINYKEVFEKIKPANAINPTLSIAIETLQLISYLPGIFKPHTLPEYDEDLIPLLKRQSEDLEWMAEFNPATDYAMEVTIFESFYSENQWQSWQAVARKWLYNQGTEYYLDLINPFLTNIRQSDIGDSQYRLGIAVTQKPTKQTAKANENYIRMRVSYSGIVTYELKPPENLRKTLNKTTGNESLVINQSFRVVNANPNRKILYLQNTGKSIVYFNFDSNLINANSPYLLPGETLNYESGLFKYSGNNNQFFPPLAEYLILDGLWVLTEGKDAETKSTNKNSVAWIEFYEVF